MIKEYKKSLCENYKDFAFIWDEELGVYVVSDFPVEERDTVFVNISDENKKDSLEDVIEYIDDYYSSDGEYNIFENDDSDINEDIDALNKSYGDIFTIEITRADNGEKEFLEFTHIKDAQSYIDRLKIDNDEFFTNAVLNDEDGNVLDSWDFVENLIEETPKKEFEGDADLKEDIVSEVEENETFTGLGDTNDGFISFLDDAVCSANVLANNLKVLHWYCSGDTFDTMHTVAEDYHNKVSEDFDFFAELALEFGVLVKNPSQMTSSKIQILDAPNNAVGFLPDDYYDALSSNILNYIEVLCEIYNIDNVPSDVISEIDSIIRYWRKENFYKNIRRSIK